MRTEPEGSPDDEEVDFLFVEQVTQHQCDRPALL